MNAQKRRNRKNSIHARLFFSMSVTSACFMLLVFLCTSLILYRQIVRTETANSASQLEYIADQFGYYLDSVQNFSKSIIVDPVVQQTVYQAKKDPSSIDTLDQIQIKNQIARIIQSTDFIYGVTVYRPDGSPVTTTEVFPASVSINQKSVPTSGNWFVSLKNSNTDQSRKINVLTHLRPFYYTGTGEMLGYLEIDIPESSISAIYRPKTSEESAHTFMLSSNGQVVSTDGSLPLNTPYGHMKELRNSHGKTVRYFSSSVVFIRPVPRVNWYIIREISLLSFFAPTLLLLLLALLIALGCILSCMYLSNRLSRSITLPIDRLIQHTRTIRQGSWTTIDEPCKNTEVAQLYSSFNHMIIDQEKLKNDLLESEKTKNRISLDLLQQQVNPHFLYNTLDNICALAELEEKDTLIDIVMNLSTFYRGALSSGKFLITIGEELAITRAYLHIMKVRYINKFDYQITCPEKLYSYPCLKLLLQPVIENSIYHGIKELSYPGKLDISIRETEDFIIFVVEDNGKGFTEEAYRQIWQTDSNHFGVKNIDERIRIYYGSSCGLHMENRKTGGCRTTLTIRKEAVIKQ